MQDYQDLLKQLLDCLLRVAVAGLINLPIVGSLNILWRMSEKLNWLIFFRHNER